MSCIVVYTTYNINHWIGGKVNRWPAVIQIGPYRTQQQKDSSQVELCSYFVLWSVLRTRNVWQCNELRPNKRFGGLTSTFGRGTFRPCQCLTERLTASSGRNRKEWRTSKSRWRTESPTERLQRHRAILVLTYWGFWSKISNYFPSIHCARIWSQLNVMWVTKSHCFEDRFVFGIFAQKKKRLLNRLRHLV